MAKKVGRVREEYYHGVRKVYYGEERVVLGGSFGITIPAGYAYCADPDEISSGGFGMKYLIRIVPTEYSESLLSSPYGVSDVTFNLYDRVSPIWPAKKDSESDFFKSTDYVDFNDMDNQNYNLPLGNYYTVTQNADIWVRCSIDGSNKASVWVICPFEIIVRDANAVFSGSIQVNTDEFPNWDTKVRELLGWINAFVEEIDDEHPLLYTEWPFIGLSGKYDIYNGIKIPVPSGCESELNRPHGIAAMWRFHKTAPLHYGLLYLEDNKDFTYTGKYEKCYLLAKKAAADSSIMFTGKLEPSQVSFFCVQSVEVYDGDSGSGVGIGGVMALLVFNKQGISILHLDLRIPMPKPRPTFSSMLYDLIRITRKLAKGVLVEGEQNNSDTWNERGVSGFNQSSEIGYVAPKKDVYDGASDYSEGETFVFPYKGEVIKEGDFNEVTKNHRGTIRHLIISEGVRRIEEKAFWCKMSLEYVQLPQSLEYIGRSAFAGARSITRIVIPQRVREIGDQAFLSCEKLSEIILPFGVEKIGDGIIYNTSVESLTIPGSCREVESSGFSEVGSEFREVQVAEGVRAINAYAFSDNENLETVYLPSSLEEIDDTAFDGCPNIKYVTGPSHLEDEIRSALWECDDVEFDWI